MAKREIIIGAIILVLLILGYLIFFSVSNNSQNTANTDENTNENGVIRVLPDSVSPGEVFEVTLYINLNPAQTYYAFEEYIPKEFGVVEGDAKNNVIKSAEFQNAKSTSLTYKVKAPQTPGEYTFSGKYAVEGTDGTKEIKGMAEVLVG